jgi:hypothetical protein
MLLEDILCFKCTQDSLYFGRKATINFSSSFYQHHDSFHRNCHYSLLSSTLSAGNTKVICISYGKKFCIGCTQDSLYFDRKLTFNFHLNVFLLASIATMIASTATVTTHNHSQNPSAGNTKILYYML